MANNPNEFPYNLPDDPDYPPGVVYDWTLPPEPEVPNPQPAQPEHEQIPDLTDAELDAMFTMTDEQFADLPPPTDHALRCETLRMLNDDYIDEDPDADPNPDVPIHAWPETDWGNGAVNPNWPPVHPPPPNNSLFMDPMDFTTANDTDDSQ